MNEAPLGFGKYFLTEKIATGGMAEIYLAKLVGPGGFEKLLVIKKIHPELSGERQFEEMFVAEAKTLVSLSHGNIVPIYELGMVDSTYFIAMEYIDGPTLEQLQAALGANNQQLSAAMSGYICAEVLKGLDYAHRKGEGVIHRDLSPRNVMLSREGEVKLVDFGIAVGTAVPKSGSLGEVPTGSFPHMSPEQAQGKELDPRSDLFTVGILLWELLTGKPLFARESEESTLAAVLEYEIPPPSMYCKDAGDALDAICAKALERDVAKRYDNAGEFLVALNRYLYSTADTVSPRDISKVVGQNCPPTTTSTRRAQTAPVKPKRSGTVPMARPQGKKRPETVRSFATHVQIRDALSVGTPVVGNPSIVDAEATRGTSTQEIPKQSMRGRSNMPLLIAGLIAIGGLGAAVAVLGSSGTTAVPALASSDAHVAVGDAIVVAVDDAAIDARTTDAQTDARVVIRKRRTDAKPAPALGSVRVAANPWADVYLRGKRLGRAPGRFSIPAGNHELELRNGEKTRRVKITVVAGEMSSLPLVDFTE